MLADFGKRVLVSLAESEAKLKHQPFPSGQRIQGRADVALEHRFGCRFVRRLRDIVGNQVAETGVILVADRRFQRDRPLGRLDDLVDLLRRNGHRFRDLFRRWLTTKFLREQVQGLAIAGDRVAHVDREPDRAALVGNRAGDRLANPPGCVRAEPEPLAPVVFLDGAHETDVAFLDQVEQGQAAVDVPLGNGDDKTQIGADELLHGLKITALDALGEIDLLVMGQQRRFGDLTQVEANRVVDEVGIEALKHIQVTFEIRLGLHLVRHLRGDLFGNRRLLVPVDVIAHELVDFGDVIGAHWVTHRCYILLALRDRSSIHALERVLIWLARFVPGSVLDRLDRTVLFGGTKRTLHWRDAERTWCWNVPAQVCRMYSACFGITEGSARPASCKVSSIAEEREFVKPLTSEAVSPTISGVDPPPNARHVVLYSPGNVPLADRRPGIAA